MYSLVIPVYKNADSITDLLNVVSGLNAKLDGKLETIFVVDGSPDNSFELLEKGLKSADFEASILVLSKNFGAFAAMRAGLAEAKGEYCAVMAADLQEPPKLILEFFKILESEPYDVVVGTREKRADPFFSKLCSNIFWRCYRKFVQKDIPIGGVDIFGCTREFKDILLTLRESNSTLIGLLFWVGFRRKMVGYNRLARAHGKSAYTIARKLKYLSDSVFAFSDLPIRFLTATGTLGIVFSLVLGLIVFVAKLTGHIQLPGYVPIILTIVFLIAFNAFALGIIGSYVWRAFENSKQRPQTIVMLRRQFNKE